jgi:hypothetical protein
MPQLVVVLIDLARPPEAVARVELVHGAGDVADALMSLAGQWRVDEAPIRRPHALDELGAPLRVALVPRRQVAVDGAGHVCGVFGGVRHGRRLAEARTQIHYL